jgi:hypothetical protein
MENYDAVVSGAIAERGSRDGRSLSRRMWRSSCGEIEVDIIMATR